MATWKKNTAGMDARLTHRERKGKAKIHFALGLHFACHIHAISVSASVSVRLRPAVPLCIHSNIHTEQYPSYRTMFSLLASRVARPIATQAITTTASRSMVTVKEGLTATDAWNKSCYSGIDYTIREDLPVYDAVQKFAAYNIGCLVTVDEAGKISGVVSERDYVCKIALLGKTSKETKVKGSFHPDCPFANTSC